MSTETENLEYLTCAQAAQRAPGRPGGSSVRRWVSHGVQLPDKSRLYLRAIRLGGKILTTPEWILEFGAACQAARRIAPQTPVFKSPRMPSATQRERRIAEARRELALTSGNHQ